MSLILDKVHVIVSITSPGSNVFPVSGTCGRWLTGIFSRTAGRSGPIGASLNTLNESTSQRLWFCGEIHFCKFHFLSLPGSHHPTSPNSVRNLRPLSSGFAESWPIYAELSNFSIWISGTRKRAGAFSDLSLSFVPTAWGSVLEINIHDPLGYDFAAVRQGFWALPDGFLEVFSLTKFRPASPLVREITTQAGNFFLVNDFENSLSPKSFDHRVAWNIPHFGHQQLDSGINLTWNSTCFSFWFFHWPKFTLYTTPGLFTKLKRWGLQGGGGERRLSPGDFPGSLLGRGDAGISWGPHPHQPLVEIHRLIHHTVCLFGSFEVVSLWCSWSGKRGLYGRRQVKALCMGLDKSFWLSCSPSGSWHWVIRHSDVLRLPHAERSGPKNQFSEWLRSAR